MSTTSIRTLTRPVFEENPIALQMLGVCSALAVTKSLATALTMCIAVTAVLCASNAAISSIRRLIPHSIRLIVQITMIASFVIVVDQVLKAYAWEVSKELSVFVGLIVTNCIVLGRAEAFAMHNPVRASVLDGLGNGLGYSVVLIAVGSVRELFGSGSLLGFVMFPQVSDGGWFMPVALMRSPPSAFFVIAGLIWLLRTVRPAQIEQPEPTSPEPDSRSRPLARKRGEP